MVRSELLQKLCNNYPNLLRRDMEKILEIIFFEISEALYRGENIEIRGFGIFKTVLRKARMGRNPKNAEFANMFRAAGLDEVDNGEWSDRMIDAVALYGDQDQIIEGLKRLQSIGASEIIASPIPFGDNIQASIKYTLQVVAKGQEIIDIN